MALKPDVSFKVEGLAELDRALAELPKATGRNVLKRIAVKALTPVIVSARGLVPVLSGKLRDSLRISTVLSKRQRTLARKIAAKEGKSYHETYAGPSALPHAHLVEFGTYKMSPRPFLRPAWDQNKTRVLDIVTDNLGKEIMEAAKRVARKTARFAKKK